MPTRASARAHTIRPAAQTFPAVDSYLTVIIRSKPDKRAVVRRLRVFIIYSSIPQYGDDLPSIIVGTALLIIRPGEARKKNDFTTPPAE